MKYIQIIFQTILLLQFSIPADAKFSCLQTLKKLKNKKNEIVSNDGMWGYFEKFPEFRKNSGDAIQLDSRINKIFFILNYLCETENGVPFNDLAMYIASSLSKKKENQFKSELLSLGKTSQQIDNWFIFFKYAQNQKTRTLEIEKIRKAINKSVPLIERYIQLAENITKRNSTIFSIRKVQTLIHDIDHFLLNEPYFTQALDEISKVPYWDINESTGGS